MLGQLFLRSKPGFLAFESNKTASITSYIGHVFGADGFSSVSGWCDRVRTFLLLKQPFHQVYLTPKLHERLITFFRSRHHLLPWLNLFLGKMRVPTFLVCSDRVQSSLLRLDLVWSGPVGSDLFWSRSVWLVLMWYAQETMSVEVIFRS